MAHVVDGGLSLLGLAAGLASIAGGLKTVESRFGSQTPPLRTTRPTWRQSETDAEDMYGFEGYSAQESFLNGQPVPRGIAGSTRPDLYKATGAIDIKNYNLSTSQGQNNLVRDVVAQAKHRAQNLPAGGRHSICRD